MLLRAMLLCLGIALDAGAQELQEAARGLLVSIEDLAGTIGVNGLPLAVSRAVGPEVPAMAERLLARWREQSGGDAVRSAGCCGWQIASRIRDGQSQVVQWRSTAAGPELYLSTAKLTDRVGPAPFVTSPLPSGCSWTTPVHGQVSGTSFIQLSAQCARSATAILDQSIRLLSREGWQWRRLGAATVQAQRGPTHMQLTAIPQPTETSAARTGLSSVVIVETHTGKEPQR